MNYIIIANGTLKKADYFARLIHLADKIIAVDGGTRHLQKMKIIPDIAIGDFDSIGKEGLEFLTQNHITMVKHRVDKDATDTELAVKWAMENGATSITLLGVTGTRLDHTLANLFLMQQIAGAGIACKILDDHNEIYWVKDEIKMNGTPGEFLSIIPMTHEIRGITITGVDFPLENGNIPMGSSLGISNRFSETIAHITIKKGMAIVTKSMD